MCVGCHIAVNFHGADCLSICRKLLITLTTLFTLYHKMYLMELELQVPRKIQSFRYLSTDLQDQGIVVSVSQNLSLSWPVIMQKGSIFAIRAIIYSFCAAIKRPSRGGNLLCMFLFSRFLSKKLQCLVNRAGSLYSLWAIV